ncbi:hypothetical protein EX30DRAFT_339819 [Ascodesmis nigricans]|uniref:Uncharacterized protein n=1 Tax=Ascodesmis nigricans TaxID=341454 RepID=A0A4S2N0G9_9PEZI|nr:hypothetical protein EX30DRAFT_339819 [Ascodesmis nigricans]
MVGYKSQFGPKLRPSPHVAGIPLTALRSPAVAAGAFGGVALLAVLFIGEGIPRVQRDVLQNIPVIGSYWDPERRKIPASDNPF